MITDKTIYGLKLFHHKLHDNCLYGTYDHINGVSKHMSYFLEDRKSIEGKMIPKQNSLSFYSSYGTCLGYEKPWCNLSRKERYLILRTAGIVSIPKGSEVECCDCFTEDKNISLDIRGANFASSLTLESFISYQQLLFYLKYATAEFNNSSMAYSPEMGEETDYKYTRIKDNIMNTTTFVSLDDLVFQGYWVFSNQSPLTHYINIVSENIQRIIKIPRWKTIKIYPYIHMNEYMNTFSIDKQYML